MSEAMQVAGNTAEMQGLLGCSQDAPSLQDRAPDSLHRSDGRPIEQGAGWEEVLGIVFRTPTAR